MRIVSERYGLTPKQMQEHRRDNKRVIARHITCWLADRYTLRSYPEIGRVLGRRDHTTVMYAVDRVDSLMAKHPKIAREVAELCAEIEVVSRAPEHGEVPKQIALSKDYPPQQDCVC